MNTPDIAPSLRALVTATRQHVDREETMNAPARPLVTVELLFDRGTWSAVVERGEQRLELGGLNELIRYLELLAAESATPVVHGLR